MSVITNTRLLKIFGFKYKKGGVYIMIDGNIDPTPYYEDKNGYRFSIAGTWFFYGLLPLLLLLWIFI